MKTINIMHYPYPLLILPYKSGIIIKQQTGGLACSQHEVEGIILPLPMYEHNGFTFMEALDFLHPGCYGHALTLEETAKLDEILKRNNIALDVNTEKRSESTEAWVYVRIMSKDDKWSYIPDSPTVSERLRFARAIKPDVTREEVLHVLQNRTLALSELADFAGEEAILTWENCD